MPDADAVEFDRPTLYLIDGYALIYRAFYAMISRPLTTSSGENTSAPYGLARFLLDLLEGHDPDFLGVVFDAGHSFREEVHPEYKATREKMPEELEASLPRCRALVEAMRIPVVEAEDWEADDVIGTLAEQAGEEGLHTVVISGDKDFYQLVDEHTWLLNPGRGGHNPVEAEWVTPENAEERLGVPPEKVPDYLALIGDSSDNVPGVRGIGEKTAPKLLEELPTLEEILERPDELSSTRARNALADHGGEAETSKRLVTIRRDAPVELDLDRFRREPPDREALRDLFLELEFHSMLREVAPEGEGPAEEDYELVTESGRVREVVEEMRGAGRLAVDTETTSLDPMRAELVGVSLCAEPGRAYYLPFGHVPPKVTEDEEGNPALALEQQGEPPDNLPPFTGEELEGLGALLADPEVEKIAHNAKYDRIVLERAGGALEGIEFDTTLASYCLDPGKRDHSLDLLVMDELGVEMTPYGDVAGRGASEVSFAEVPLDEALQYAGEDADYTLRLSRVLREKLEENHLLDLMQRIETPLVPVLARMEQWGIGLDLDFFDRLEERVTRELRLVEEEIRKIAGEEVNLRSVPQLRELLFGELDLPVLKRTKTGPSTDESVLSELAARGHEVPRLILDYRELDKLHSTYVSVLPELVHPETGRVHSSFNQTVAATGRLSSSDPNLQNIPIRSVLGREIRKGFVPEDGWVFLGADYSQVELRILAHLSGDPAFVDAFRAGRDIHRETAARIFGGDPDDVSAGMRERAKTINYATIYGQGPGALASQLGVSRDDAERFIEGYFERFSGVRGYIEEMQERAREQGYVETLTGRRRYIPEIRSRNPGVRGFGERTAANTPIQGTAADLIKIAMIRLDERLDPGDDGDLLSRETSAGRRWPPRPGARARMLVQVHDELLFEVREEAVEEVRELVVEEMAGAMELDVPLEVDVGVGESWYEAKG
ncbi:MAG: DNA polymerase I [Gemmatimonadota bacterium]